MNYVFALQVGYDFEITVLNEKYDMTFVSNVFNEDYPLLHFKIFDTIYFDIE